MLKRKSICAPSRIESATWTFLSPSEQRQQLYDRLVDHVDLAAQQGVDGGLRVGDVEPLDTVGMHDLAAAQADAGSGRGL